MAHPMHSRMLRILLLLMFAQSIQAFNDTDLSLLVEIMSNRSYDYRLTPSYQGNEVAVELGIYINNIGDIDEANMQYGMNVYFRQQWVDHRLEFASVIPNVSSIALPDPYYADIWLPDTFIENGKTEKRHDVTLPNKGLRVYSDGTIFYSQRLSLDMWCPITLSYFPLDTQACRLNLMTYRYNAEEMTLSWMATGPVEMGPVELSLFELTGFSLGDCSYGFSTGRFSCVYAEFNFKRQIGYYLSQIYIPSLLVVFLSWVSFWLEPSAVPARVSLGLLTILTMTNQMAQASASLPKVSYLKAIDVWLTTCLTFLFAGLVEFAIVNSMARRDSIRKEAQAAEKERAEEDEPEVEDTLERDISEVVVDYDKKRAKSATVKSSRFKNLTASHVDKFSRVTFPVCFAIFNICYWVLYGVV